MTKDFSFFSVAIALFVSAGSARLSAATPGTKEQIEKTVASPSENISLAFHLTDGTPSYAVSFKTRPAILSSALGDRKSPRLNSSH